MKVLPYNVMGLGGRAKVKICLEAIYKRGYPIGIPPGD